MIHIATQKVGEIVRRFKRYTEYKTVGLPWPLSVPSHWSVQRLKYVAGVRPSNVDKKTVEGQQDVRLCNYVDVYKNEFITPDLDFMKATATNAQVKVFAVKAGDVIITKDSESWDDIAVPALVKQDLEGIICGYHLALVRPNPIKHRGDYLFRCFMAEGLCNQFRVAANGITRFGLSVGSINTAFFPTPPLEEQRQIASFLDRETAKIDALVDKKKRLIELLQEKRTALISHAVTKGLDPNVPMKDSGVEWLGKIPAHWEVIQSKRLFRVRNEPAAESDEQLTASQKYGMLPQTEFMELEGRRVVVTTKGTESLRHVEPDDFVISLRSFQGGIEWCKLSGSVTFHYIVLQAVKALHTAYFALLFKSDVYIQALRSTADFIRDGQDLRYSNFVLIPLPVVPMDEQVTIAKFLDQQTAKIDSLIEVTQRTIELLREYRTALISAAVTGKIDVREEVV